LSETDRQKWNQRYAEGAYRERRHPSALLAELLPRLPRGRALDVACGAGRNALHLAAAGYEVDAIDISSVALEHARRQAGGTRVRWIEADLRSDGVRALPAQDYALILMVRYVDMALLGQLGERLADGGHLLIEQHLRSAGAAAGPRNPAFRLGPNELLRAAGRLRVLYYREDIVPDPDGREAALAQLLACRGTPFFEASGAGLV
jgi:SAM-dependent methyltransferase